jgi:hypothetical protein
VQNDTGYQENVAGTPDGPSYERIEGVNSESTLHACGSSAERVTAIACGGKIRVDAAGKQREIPETG